MTFNFNRFAALPGSVYFKSADGHQHLTKFDNIEDEEVINHIKLMAAQARKEGTTLAFEYNGAAGQKTADLAPPREKEVKKPTITPAPKPKKTELTDLVKKALEKKFGKSAGDFVVLTADHIKDIKALATVTSANIQQIYAAYIKAGLNYDKALELLSKIED